LFLCGRSLLLKICTPMLGRGNLALPPSHDLFLLRAFRRKPCQLPLTNLMPFAYPNHFSINLFQRVARGHCLLFRLPLFTFESLEQGGQVFDFVRKLQHARFFLP